MNMNEIELLIKMVEDAKIEEFKYKDPKGSSIFISKTSKTQVVQAAPSAPVAQMPVLNAAPEAPHQEAPKAMKGVPSPLVGTFYSSSAPGATPYVKIGDTIKAGDVVCIVEAMKVMNHIKSEKDGVVKSILVENGEGVEYGQILIELA